MNATNTMSVKQTLKCGIHAPEKWQDDYDGSDADDFTNLPNLAPARVCAVDEYPACPDHLEKKTIWKVLQVKETIGVELTESLAMWPDASVSGYYFGNPEARYFGVGKIKEDQVKDFAERKGISFEKAEKWLNPNIAD